MIRISLCAVSSRTSVQTLQYNKVRAQVYCGVGSSNIYSALCAERKKNLYGYENHTLQNKAADAKKCISKL